jgi:hypothetical protein
MAAQGRAHTISETWFTPPNTEANVPHPKHSFRQLDDGQTQLQRSGLSEFGVHTEEGASYA